MRSITVFDAPKAASGRPPPIDLARQIMSGFRPKYSEAPPQQSFAPVFTSSKISNAPFRSQSFRSPSRKPGSGIHKPTFIMIGSRIMAAISPGYCWNRYATESRSLKLATRTLARLAFDLDSVAYRFQQYPG